MRSLLLLLRGSSTLLFASAALFYGLNGKTVHAAVLGVVAAVMGAVTVIAWREEGSS